MIMRLVLIGAIVVGVGCKSETPRQSWPAPTAPTTPTDPTVPVDPNDIQDVEFGLTARPTNSSCVAAARPQVNANIELEGVYPGLSFSRPLLALQSPNDSSRWYVVEQSGRILWFDATSANPNKNTFLDIRSAVLSYADSFPGYADELGLLGMAFDPDYEANGYVYLSYTISTGGSGVQSKITRMTLASNGNELDEASETTILTVSQPYSNHNGGHIVFGPDNYLYIGLGDGGSGGDPLEHGQNKETLLGTILRIDVHEQSPYKIPGDNPLVGTDGRDEIWAYGLRNPWRFEFDADGTLWAGDVGQNAYEEVDIIIKGGNYGWNVREGAHCYNAANCDSAGMIDPVAEYGRNVGQSITGGFVYRGNAIAGLQGAYLYGDYGTGNIWSLKENSSGGYDAERILSNTGHNISSFAQDNEKELYILSFATGKMYKLVAETTMDTSTFPTKLSETGCAHPNNLKQGSSGMIQYDVNVPFWSDGAEKYRWMGIPDGTSISLNAFGDFIFPIGTVLRKDFYFEDTLVETRLMMHHQDGDWAGYTYRWRSDGSDADWLISGATVNIGSKTWNIPAEGTCLQCHTSASGRSLSAEVLQLNKSFVYPGNLRANQLKTLSHIGLISEMGEIDETRSLSTDSSVELSKRVRSYLHANCSNCHQPGGTGGGSMDFRFDAESLNLCGVVPTYGNLDIEGAQLVFPAEPQKSILLERIKRLDDKRMPPVASSVVDTDAVELMQEWISSLSSCP